MTRQNQRRPTPMTTTNRLATIATGAYLRGPTKNVLKVVGALIVIACVVAFLVFVMSKNNQAKIAERGQGVRPALNPSKQDSGRPPKGQARVEFLYRMAAGQPEIKVHDSPIYVRPNTNHTVEFFVRNVDADKNGDALGDVVVK